MPLMRIEDALPYGKENAIPSKQLAEVLGFSNVRALQAAVERERRAGAIILSTTQNGGGYFKSENHRDIAAFVKTLNNRARATREATLSAQAELDRLSGQTHIDGC